MIHFHLCIIGSKILEILIPLYISVLMDPATSDPSTQPKNRQVLHSHFLQRVTEIGPKNPVAFRNIMQTTPTLKAKLESAIRVNQSAKASAKGVSGTSRGFTQPQQPSIKLKMDFSNFK